MTARTLVLLRHAKAERPGDLPDFDRRLDEPAAQYVRQCRVIRNRGSVPKGRVERGENGSSLSVELDRLAEGDRARVGVREEALEIALLDRAILARLDPDVRLQADENAEDDDEKIDRDREPVVPLRAVGEPPWPGCGPGARNGQCAKPPGGRRRIIRARGQIARFMPGEGRVSNIRNVPLLFRANKSDTAVSHRRARPLVIDA